MRHLPLLLASCLIATGPSTVQAADTLLDSIPATITTASTQYRGMLDLLRQKNEERLPRTIEKGELKVVKPTDWTSGFFPGSLWLLFAHTGDEAWKKEAMTWTARLESIQDFRGNHDVGFMLYCSYGTGLRLAQPPLYDVVLKRGALSLTTRYDHRVGLIKSWDTKKWQYPVIIDNMMNLELLTWAARATKNPRFNEIAINHADKTLANHFRPDHSSYHVVGYNPDTGAAEVKQTHQGNADDSAWARGQAWGLYGYTMMFRETRKPAYLDQARKIAGFIMNHPRLPADKVPYWDFDAPGIPDVPRDASAAAVMASALIELSTLVPADQGQPYLDLARQQLLSLSSPAYLAQPGSNSFFILMHSTGHLPGKIEIDVPLNYADYYFLEALERYRKLMTPPPAK